MDKLTDMVQYRNGHFVVVDLFQKWSVFVDCQNADCNNVRLNYTAGLDKFPLDLGASPEILKPALFFSSQFLVYYRSYSVF